MAVLARHSLLLVKVESNNGVDVTPAVADAILVEAAEPSFEIGFAERPIINGGSVDALPIRTTRKVSCAVTVRLRGSGTAATAPKWARLLQAAGFKPTAGTDVDITPDTSEKKTVSAYLYSGGHLYKMIGCAFADPTITYDNGWLLTGTLVGKDGGVTAVSVPASPVFDTGAFLSGLGCTFTYGSYSAILRNLTISLGSEIAELGNLNDATGFDHMLATGFKPGGTMVIEDQPIGTKDWRTIALAQEPASVEALTFIVGSAAGSKMTILMPNCRLGSWTEGNEAGVRTLEFPLYATDSAAGLNDWITITTE